MERERVTLQKVNCVSKQSHRNYLDLMPNSPDVHTPPTNNTSLNMSTEHCLLEFLKFIRQFEILISFTACALTMENMSIILSILINNNMYYDIDNALRLCRQLPKTMLYLPKQNYTK